MGVGRGPSKDISMSGRILIVERIATARILSRTGLSAAGYDCSGCADLNQALTVLKRGGFDLAVIDLGEHPEAVLAFCRALREIPATAGLPVIVPGRFPDAAARLAMLQAGADEVIERPFGEALLQARIRNLLRARDTEVESLMRDHTHRALGFAEAPAAFQPAQPIALVSPRRGAALDHLARDLPGPVTVLSPRHLPSDPGPGPDLFVLDGTGLLGQGQPPEALFRLVADLRSRSATRLAAQMVLLPDETPEAALLLDLGADDIVPDRAGKAEIQHRARRLLRRKAQADQLRDTLRNGMRAAVTDELTGLWNRRYAMPHLARLAQAAQSGHRTLAVMVLDIDHFKTINDGFGHPAGDRILSQVAARLRDGLRPADLIARIGGEEFLVAMPDTTIDQARAAAERLRRMIETRPFELPPRAGAPAEACQVTISVGVALGPMAQPPQDAAEALLQRADTALYGAKAGGRNQVAVCQTAA